MHLISRDHQVQPRLDIHQALVGSWPELQHSQVIPLPQEGASHPPGKHDHGAPASAGAAEETEGVRTNSQRLHLKLQRLDPV